MHKMTDAEAWAFLAAGSRTTVFASTQDDGRPHAVPTWYLLDGDELVFTTWHASVKAANIRRDPRVTVVVQDPAPPYDYVSVDGEATLLDDAGRVSSHLDRARCQVHGRRPCRGIRSAQRRARRARRAGPTDPYPWL